MLSLLLLLQLVECNAQTTYLFLALLITPLYPFLALLLSYTVGLCDTVSLDAATECRIVRGVTSILPDSNVTNAESTT